MNPKNRKMLKVEAPNAGVATRHDAHPFQGDAEAGGDCDFCGAPKKRIIHHPTRIRAAKAVQNIAAAQLDMTAERKQAIGQN